MKRIMLSAAIFLCLGTLASAQVHFHPVETGLGWAIIVDDATIDHLPMITGDEIGVFDGNLCVGAGVVQNRFPLIIAAWQDIHNGLPGFTIGHPILYRLWDASAAIEYEANADYIIGNGTFRDGMFAEVILAAVTQNIQPDIVVEPLLLDFGEVLGMHTANLPVMVSNVGDGNLTLFSAGTSIGPFSVTEVENLLLEPGDAIQLDVEFSAPPEVGEEQGTLTIFSDDPDEPEVVVELVGQVIAAWDHFDPVEPTEVPYAIVVNEATIDGDLMIPGDEIGIFDGDLCVGAMMVGLMDWPLLIYTWQAEMEMPGFVDGHPILYRLWSSAQEMEVEAEAEYLNGHGEGAFGDDVYSEVNLAGRIILIQATPIQGHIFDMVSFNIIPLQLNPSWVFASLENLTIAYQDNGRIYIPNLIDTIGNVDVRQAYQLFSRIADIWIFEGTRLDPLTQYTQFGNRWNWLGFPFDHEVPVVIALSEITDAIVIIQNEAGELWIPGLVNTLGNMRPEEGYYVFANRTVTFTFTDIGPKTVNDDEVWDIIEVAGSPVPTGLPYAVLVRMTKDLLAQNPATVEIYDEARLVGKAVALNDHDLTPVIVWQGSPEHDLPGFIPGNRMTINVQSADGTLLATNQSVRFGEAPYAEITLELQKSFRPVEFRVDVAYPNPFNPTVTVPFALPSEDEVNFTVFNLLGQQVYHASRNFQAGNHHFVFNVEEMGLNLVSGIYFLQVQYQGENHIQKVMLMK